MSKQMVRILIGALLILLGGVFLLQQLLNFPLGSLLFALLFAAAGVVFLLLLIRDKTKWWWSIPGFTLLGLGALIALDRLFPAVSKQFGGALFLGAIAVSFLVIYLLQREHWWPIIPAGALATVAITSAIPQGYGAQGAVFFLGIGATFAVLGLLPMGKAEKWPWIPGGICLVLGVILLLTSGTLWQTSTAWIWSLIFIAAGAFFVIRALLRKKED